MQKCARASPPSRAVAWLYILKYSKYSKFAFSAPSVRRRGSGDLQEKKGKDDEDIKVEPQMRKDALAREPLSTGVLRREQGRGECATFY